MSAQTKLGGLLVYVLRSCVLLSSLIAVLAGGMLLTAYSLLTGERIFPDYARENHTLENAQVALLLAAAVLQLWRARFLAGGDGRERTLAILLAFLCVACALRELDIDRLGDERYFEPLETALRTLTLAGLGGYLLSHLRQVKALFDLRRLSRDPVMGFAIAGVLLYCLSWPLDKKVFGLSVVVALFLEEWVELWASVSFLTAGCFTRRARAS